MNYDRIVIGAGLYGLYSAWLLAQKGHKVLVLEHDDAVFKRATYINQARVHMGYHYPRSYSTAIKSAHYFERFNADFKDCILSEFDKIYAISKNYSWTDADQFEKFCRDSDILCEPVNPLRYFKKDLCSGVFLTKEYTYDSSILAKIMLKRIQEVGNVDFQFESRIDEIENKGTHYSLKIKNGDILNTEYLINTTYASVNQILNKVKFPLFNIKYELCEIILCEVDDVFKDIGITVMDGPFFSIMPFGKTGLHSLTSVTFTPHITSYDGLPRFKCQNKVPDFCSPDQLGNCNDCAAKPETAWDYMSTLAKKYLKDSLQFEYKKSLFSMKPILKASEIDDSRPTVIKEFSSNPAFISVLSGKINTMYDLEGILE